MNETLYGKFIGLFNRIILLSISNKNIRYIFICQYFFFKNYISQFKPSKFRHINVRYYYKRIYLGSSYIFKSLCAIRKKYDIIFITKITKYFFQNIPVIFIIFNNKYIPVHFHIGLSLSFE